LRKNLPQYVKAPGLQVFGTCARSLTGNAPCQSRQRSSGNLERCQCRRILADPFYSDYHPTLQFRRLTPAVNMAATRPQECLQRETASVNRAMVMPWDRRLKMRGAVRLRTRYHFWGRDCKRAQINLMMAQLVDQSPRLTFMTSHGVGKLASNPENFIRWAQGPGSTMGP